MKIEKQPKSIILQVPSLLWDGKKRLPGTLSLSSKKLLFKFDDFQKSNLNLEIQLDDIETVDSLLLFDFAQNCLKVQSKRGLDLFVLDNPIKFRKAIMIAIANLNNP